MTLPALGTLARRQSGDVLLDCPPDSPVLLGLSGILCWTTNWLSLDDNDGIALLPRTATRSSTSISRTSLQTICKFLPGSPLVSSACRRTGWIGTSLSSLCFSSPLLFLCYFASTASSDQASASCPGYLQCLFTAHLVSHLSVFLLSAPFHSSSLWGPRCISINEPHVWFPRTQNRADAIALRSAHMCEPWQ